MADPLLVVGLGNPGPVYAKTRHNLGFMVADVLAARAGSAFKAHKKSGAEVATGRLAGHPVILGKPRSYMNESGRQMAALTKFYSVPPAELVVIHDDLDIEVRQDPAEVRRRRRRPQRVAVRGVGVEHQRLSPRADRHRPTAGAQGPGHIRAGELHRG